MLFLIDKSICFHYFDFLTFTHTTLFKLVVLNLLDKDFALYSDRILKHQLMIKRLCLAISIIVMAYNAKAEGYAVNLQGNKQTGMGHVGTALNFDASSMQWNPGALATLSSKYSFSLGASLTLTKAEYTGSEGKFETDNSIRPPFYFYGSMKVNDKLAVGLGTYTPFGNKMKWGDNWAGRYLVQDISLKAIFIQPTISYKINDWLSAGVGLNIVYGDVELNRAFPLVPDPRSPIGPTNPILADGGVELTGSTIKYGYNVGIFLQPTEKFSIGISYRSKVDIKLDESDGDGKFSYPSTIPGLSDANAQALIAGYKAGGADDGNFSATLPLPSSLNLGFAYQINDKWLVSADANFIKWNEYKALTFNSSNAAALNSTSIRKWDNTITWRFGTRYTANEKLDLYAGLYFDETPTNDMYYTPETPGANKVGVSAGFSYKFTNKLSLDASLLYNEGKKVNRIDNNSGFAGEYKYRAWLPGIGITYNF